MLTALGHCDPNAVQLALTFAWLHSAWLPGPSLQLPYLEVRGFGDLGRGDQVPGKFEMFVYHSL